MGTDNIELGNATLYIGEIGGMLQEFHGTIQELELSSAEEVPEEYKQKAIKAFEAVTLQATVIVGGVLALLTCKNRRLVWLALHHPKKRVRKKNLHRIQREFRTEE